MVMENSSNGFIAVRYPDQGVRSRYLDLNSSTSVKRRYIKVNCFRDNIKMCFIFVGLYFRIGSAR